MKKIYKYQFNLKEVNTILIPEGSEILSLQTQHNIPCIWVLVDTEKEPVERKFLMYGTGEEMKDHKETDTYIGTSMIGYGTFVYHLFERKD